MTEEEKDVSKQQHQYHIPKKIRIVWDAFAPVEGKAPRRNNTIDVRQAKSIAIQCDTLHGDSISDNVDINILGSFDNKSWDTVNYTEVNLGDNERKTIIVTVGIGYLKLTADNNHASSNAKPEAEVMIRE